MTPEKELKAVLLPTWFCPKCSWLNTVRHREVGKMVDTEPCHGCGREYQVGFRPND